MFLRCINKVTIKQQPSTDWPTRTGTLTLDFFTSFESSDSWEDLTNKGRLTIPKNLYYRDQNGKLQPLAGPSVNAGGFSDRPPLFLRGDAVTIEAGYIHRTTAKRDVRETPIMFKGFISKVGSKIPIELDLEDNMYKLKQVPVNTHTFSKSDSLEDIIRYLLKDTPFTFKALTTTTFGTFAIGNETVAQVLYRLRKEFGFESYFRGDELRCGALVYLPEEAVTERFHFQKNIISDELQYSRKDDVILSAIAHNTITEDNGTTKDGATKTKHKRIEVLVTIKNGEAQPYKEIKRGDTVPLNDEGERRTLFFPGAKTVKELGDLAYAEIIKYYYTGLRGSFTTFGLPFVRQGDNAEIRDAKLPERNGVYRIKKVNYNGGDTIGLRQRITLDFKLPI
jgi:hypothetical protein